MKKILLYTSILTIIFSITLNASETKIINYNNYFYSGTIAGKNILASLKIQTNIADGFYYFIDTKKNKKLIGTKKNNTLLLKEQDNANSYELSINENKSIKGTSKKNEVVELKLLDGINTANITQYSFSEKPDNIENREFNYLIERWNIENTNNLKSINSINSKLKSSIDSFEKSIKKELTFFRKEYIANYQYFYQLESHYADTNIIVLLEKKYVYTGGANGTSYITPKMYSLKNGAEISYKTSSIIKNKSDIKLIELTKNKLLKLNEEDMYFDFNSITLPNTFYVSANGITFTYSLYEIAPRVAGIIELTFTFEEIKPFISNMKNIEYLFNR